MSALEVSIIRQIQGQERVVFGEGKEKIKRNLSIELRRRGSGIDRDKHVTIENHQVKPFNSAAPRGFLAPRDFRQRPRIVLDRFRHSLAVNKLSFAAAGNQSGRTQDFQMMRNRSRRDAAQRDDFSAIHVFCVGNSFENPQACLIAQRF